MRMPKFRRFTNGDFFVSYTAEDDEVFKSNSEQQDKRREKNEPMISKPPEEVSLSNLELLRLKFKKPIVRS